jgi:hypothetical protein
MINFAPTTRRTKRFGTDATAEDKATHLERLRQGLAVIDDNTERVEVDTLRGATLDHNGIMGNYRFSKEGFASLCSRLSSHTFGFLKGIDSSDMSADSKKELQTKIFNDLWRARSHELDGSKFLVSTESDGPHKIEAVHSKTYGYLSNVDSLNMVTSNLSSEETLEYYKLHGRTLDVGIGDPTKNFRIPTRRAPDGEDITALRYVQNSEDGSSRFMVGLGLYWYICVNGCRFGTEYNIASARHRSGVLESVRHQLRETTDFDFGNIITMFKNSTEIKLTDELRGKSFTWLKDRVGARQAKEFLSDDVAFVQGEVPSLYEINANITEKSHSGGYSVRDQSDLETTAFKYLQKFARAA